MNHSKSISMKYLEAEKKLFKNQQLNSNDVIELLASHNTLTKKLTCHYLVDSSCKDSELSLLTANLLLRDSADANPSIRSCSLLALSSLPEVVEAAVSSVIKALKDSSAQVRRAAALCCIKLHQHSPSIFFDSGLVDLLYDAIRDEDPIVITNCLLALENVLSSEGSLVINRKIATYLVQHINIFPDSSLLYILNILLRYNPKTEDEMFFILNSLDCFLNSNNPAILHASSQLFLKVIDGHPHLNKDLLSAINVPICKFLGQNNPEISYLLIDYLLKLSLEFKLVDYFGEHYALFLVRAKDPPYLKQKKLEILPLLCTTKSVEEIIGEAKRFIGDSQIYEAAFFCLKTTALFNDESLTSVVTVLATNLCRPKENIVVSALECLLSLFLKRSNCFRKNETMCELLSVNYINALLSPTILENNSELVIRCLQTSSFILHNNSVIEILKELVVRSELWSVDVQSIFVTTVAILFLEQPGLHLLSLSSILQRHLNSSNKDLQNHTAFVYAALEEGPEIARKLLTVADRS